MIKLSITFRLLYNRKNKKNECPLYVRLTRAGKRLEFASGVFIDPLIWLQHHQKAITSKKDGSIAVNKYIETTRVRLNDIYTLMFSQDVTLRLEDIRDRFLGRTKKSDTLLQVLQYHLTQFEQLVGKPGYSKGRFKRFKVFEGKMKNFLKIKYMCEDYALSKLSRSFISNFEHYLRTNDQLDTGTVGSYLKILKKLINVALENEWLQTNPFLGFKVRAKASDRIYLIKQEIDAIENKEFLTERLSIVRDTFIFCVYTGLSHSDVEKLRRDNLVTGIDGKQWLSFKRTKTDVPCNIPLLDHALAILRKYDQYPECLYKGTLLPVRTNQKMNEYLKEIGDLCGINKKITCHTARHTYATTILIGNGISIEVVSKLLGHRDIKTTQIYAKMTNNRIVEEFKSLKHL